VHSSGDCGVHAVLEVLMMQAGCIGIILGLLCVGGRQGGEGVISFTYSGHNA